MSRVSLNNMPSNPRLNNRLRTLSRTESETSCEEAARLTADDEDVGSLIYAELPPPPDGGYGWVIVFASFMCNLIVDGIAYTFGVFLNDFVNDFNEPKGTIAWVGSLLSGVYLAVGPLVSALCNKYGCRAVTIAGAILATIAFVLSTYSKSVLTMMLSYGLLGGIGFGMIYLPSVVAVGYYFETRRSLATGIAVCGSGVGTFTFAPLADWLLKQYDWRGANLILAGLILNCVIFGALMRPLVYPKNCGEKPLLQRMAEEKRLQMERGSIGGSYFVVQLPDGTMEKRLKAPINIDPGVHSSLNLEQFAGTGGMPNVPTQPTLISVPTAPTLPTIAESKVVDENQQQKENKCKLIGVTPSVENRVMSRNVSSPVFSAQHNTMTSNGSVPAFDRTRKHSTGERFKPSLAAIKATSRQSISSRAEVDAEGGQQYGSKLSISNRMVRPMSRKDIFYSGSVVNLREYQSQKSLQGYRNSVLSLPQTGISIQGEIEPSAQYSLCPCCPPSFSNALSAMLDMSLLKDPVFMMIGISNVFGMAGLYIPFVYILDAAKIKGIDPGQASFLVSIIGITNTFGRIICGWVADYPWMNSFFLNNMCLVLATIAVSCAPLCTSYAAFVIFAIAFGIAISGYISLTSIILVDLLGLEKLTNAFGLLILFRGVAAIIGSPLAGAVYDSTQSYDYSFLLGGALFFLSALFSFIAPLMKRFVKVEEPLEGGEDVLTPIDEEEDPDDSPITIASHHRRRPNNNNKNGIGPHIIKTVASPQDEDTPQRESVL